MRQTNVRASVVTGVYLCIALFAIIPRTWSADDPNAEINQIFKQQHHHPAPVNTVDTSSISVAHADTYLRIQIPSVDILNPSDSFRCIHPSGLYYPNGFLGWKRWLVLTKGADYLEDPFIRVSNDGENWYRFGTGTDSCPDPLFTVADCQMRGAPAVHLSDADLYRTRDSTLWVIWRATFAFPTWDGNALYAASSRDAIHWSRPIQIVTYTEGSASLISPAVWRSPTGGYRMWTVEAADEICPTTMLWLWHADSIGMAWTLIDTVRQAGTSVDWPGTDQLSGLDSAWHVEVVPNGRNERVALLTARNGYDHPLYLGKSTDDGASVDFMHAPILAGRGDSTSWDARDTYRSTGYWVNKNGETVLELIYSGLDNAASPTWRVGRTEVHFHALGPVAIVAPGDTNTSAVFGQQPTFKWTPAAEPDSSDTVRYRLELSTSPDFTSAFKKDSLLSPQYTLETPLQLGQQYYWRLSDWDRAGRQSVNPAEGDVIPFPSGDINMSGVLDLTDLSTLIMYLTTSHWASTAPHLAADVNADCRIDLTDLSWIVAYLTTSSPHPLPGCVN
jgi:hypothetical protein